MIERLRVRSHDGRDLGQELSSEGLSLGCESPPLIVSQSSCPNPFNVKSKGLLPVGLLGGTIDLSQIDPTVPVTLSGVPALRSTAVVMDVAAPFGGTFTGGCNDCSSGFDAIPDVMLFFDRQKLTQAIGSVADGQCLTLKLAGKLKNGRSFEGEDVVRIIKKGK